jgi:2-polyprenyl-6-methoxyphenol hydroxylase-like FAD-dependent oxidoreductase
MANERLKIAIIGGSLGGLFSGIALQKAGHDVSIFEKTSGKLKERGAGIVLQYELMDFLKDYGIANVEDINVPIYQRRYVDKNGNDAYLDNTTQLMTAWGTIYHKLMEKFPAENYHHGYKFTSFEQDADIVIVNFENNPAGNFDLLVAADGIHSKVRKQLFPTVHPTYAGYVGWRGVVGENELPLEVLKEFRDRFTFYNMPNSHILCYLIPGHNDEISPGNRRLNWIWYWNVKPGEQVRELLTDAGGRYRSSFVPEGFVKNEFIEKQRSIADEVMPPIFKELVKATKQPFIQPINDLAVQRMYFGRVVLVGDAAFNPRPHTAASTAKAVANGVSLAEILDANLDIEEALSIWEKPNLQMGASLKQRGISLGNQSQFGIT